MYSSTHIALMALLLLAVGLVKSDGADQGDWNLQRPLDFDPRGPEGYGDGDFLEKLLSPPAKRHWCRKGMTYSPLLGSCKLSFSECDNEKSTPKPKATYQGFFNAQCEAEGEDTEMQG